MSLDDPNALIGDWSSTNTANQPPGGDNRRQGDDQLRGTKGTIRRHFPNFVGTAASPKTVNASEDEINTLVGISLTDKIDTFPSGTVMLFENNTITGWTKKTAAAYNNIAIRINTGTIADTTYGSLDFDVVFARTATDGHSLVDGELPTTDLTHDHQFRTKSLAGNTTQDTTNYLGNQDSGGDFLYTSNGVNLNNTEMVVDRAISFGSGQPHTHGNDITVRYRDVCAFQKD